MQISIKGNNKFVLTVYKWRSWASFYTMKVLKHRIRSKKEKDI